MLRMELARRNKKLSQEQLGNAARVSQSLISLIELERGIATRDQMDRLSRVLGIPVEQMLDEIHEGVEAVGK